MQFTVAIDGPAAAGKGTIAKGLAQTFGFAHLDTGLLYRAVARRVLDGDTPEIAAATLRHHDIARDDLRTPEVAEKTSQIATNPDVRAALAAFQREFARREGGTVMDGRDIGTVICPAAEVKFYVTASAEVRAHRRWLEHSKAGHDLTQADVLEDIRTRDARDRDRKDSPMRPADDAILFDTSELSIEDALEKAIATVRTRMEPDT